MDKNAINHSHNCSRIHNFDAIAFLWQPFGKQFIHQLHKSTPISVNASKHPKPMIKYLEFPGQYDCCIQIPCTYIQYSTKSSYCLHFKLTKQGLYLFQNLALMGKIDDKGISTQNLTNNKSTLVQGNGLIPDGNKPSPEPILPKIYVAIWWN